MKLRLLMSVLQNSVRHSVGKEVDLLSSRKTHFAVLGHCRGQMLEAMECDVVGFCMLGDFIWQ